MRLLVSLSLNLVRGFLLMIVLMFLVMWLFMIRPQNKERKRLEEMRNSLKKGDKVITAGGIYGVVADVDAVRGLLARA